MFRIDGPTESLSYMFAAKETDSYGLKVTFQIKVTFQPCESTLYDARPRKRAERKGNNTKGFKYVYLKVRASTWP